MMRAQWQTLPPRQRNALAAGVAVALALGLVAVLWLPFLDSTGRLQQQLTAYRQDVAWMRAALPRLPPPRASMRPSALLAQLEQSLKTAGLAGALKRLEPSADGVQLTLENAPFEQCLHWLSALQTRVSVSATAVTAEPGKAPGAVNLSLRFESGA